MTHETKKTAKDILEDLIHKRKAHVVYLEELLESLPENVTPEADSALRQLLQDYVKYFV